MITDVYMQESAIVRADAAARELRYLKCQFVHLLQGTSGNVDVSRHTPCVFTVSYTTELLIMLGAAISIVHDDRRTSLISQRFQSSQKTVVDLQLPAATAGWLFLGKMSIRISHPTLLQGQVRIEEV